MILCQPNQRGGLDAVPFLRRKVLSNRKDADQNEDRTRFARKEGKVHKTGRNHMVNERDASPPAKNVYASHCNAVIRHLPNRRALTNLVHVLAGENGDQGHSKYSNARSERPYLEI